MMRGERPTPDDAARFFGAWRRASAAVPLYGAAVIREPRAGVAEALPGAGKVL